MDFNNPPTHEIHILWINKLITDADYARLTAKLDHIVATLKRSTNQQEIEKLMNEMIDEEISLFLKDEHFRYYLAVSFRAIIYKNAAGVIQPGMVDDLIKKWFATRLSPRERILFVQANVFDLEEQEIKLRIKADFDRVLSEDFVAAAFTALVADAFAYFDQFEIVKANGDMTLLFKLPKIYSELGRILDCNVDDLLVLWFHRHAKRSPKPIAKLKTAMGSRMKLMKKHGLMESVVLAELTEKCNALFQQIEENHLEVAKTNVEAMIGLLKSEALETADREFFADFYLEIGIHLSHDFTEQLKNFLYSENTVKNLLKNRLPWE